MFLELVHKIVAKESVTWHALYKGEELAAAQRESWSKKPMNLRARYVSAGKVGKEKRMPTVAFLQLQSPADVLALRTGLHGHTMVNDKGQSFRLSVEYAPQQRVPRPSKRRDAKEGTIEKDKDFLDFVSSLEGAGGETGASGTAPGAGKGKLGPAKDPGSKSPDTTSSDPYRWSAARWGGPFGGW